MRTKFLRKKASLFLAFAMTIVVAFGTVACDDAENGGTVNENQNNTENIGEPDAFPCAEKNGKSLNLIEYGKSDYQIVVSENATSQERYAAEELQYFLQQATTCRLDIVTDAGMTHDNTKKRISVGKTALLENENDVVLKTDTLECTPVLKTCDNTVYLTGWHEEGTLYSVYKFLYYEIGFEAFAVNCLYYRNCDVLPLLEFDYTYAPVMDFTADYYEVTGMDTVKAAARMYMVSAGSGGYGFYGRQFSRWSHSAIPLLDPNIYQAEHPDWYGNGQVCYTNESGTEQMIVNVCADLESNPNAKWIMIGGSDSLTACGCKTCLQQYEIYGVSGVYMRYLNKIGEGVENYFKAKGSDRKPIIYALAYNAYAAAPIKVTGVDENGKELLELVDESVKARWNVGVCYTPIEACLVHSVDDEKCETNHAVYRSLRGWNLVTDNLMVYDYGTNFTSYFTHLNDWDSLEGRMRAYQAEGVKYIRQQANAVNGVSPFQSMRIYVKSKLAWDTTLNIDDLINRFMQYYYGDGSSEMRKFYDDLDEHFEWIGANQGKTCGTTYHSCITEDCWPRNTLLAFETTLQSAMNIIEQGNNVNKERQRYNVYKEYIVMKIQEYSFYPSFYSEVDREQVVRELNDAIEQMKITRVSEHVFITIK